MVFRKAFQRQNLVPRATRLAYGLHGRETCPPPEGGPQGSAVASGTTEANGISVGCKSVVQDDEKVMEDEMAGNDGLIGASVASVGRERVGGRLPGGGAHPKYVKDDN